MGMRATVTLTRYKKGGGIERREFPCRSFLLGLIQLLYCQHAQLGISDRSVATLNFNYSGNDWLNASYDDENLVMAGGGGRGNTRLDDYPGNEEMGIVVGIGTHAVTADDRGLDRRISTIAGTIGRTLRFLGTGTLWGLAYDGTNVYYVDMVSTPSQVWKVDPWTGAEVTHFAAPGTNWNYNRGLTHDGTYLWITGYDSGKSPVQRIYQINDTTGAVIQDWGAPANDDANGLTWDGTYLWIARNQSPAEIYKYTTGGVQQAVITPPRASVGAYLGLAWDGTYLWGVSAEQGKSYGARWICKFNPADGSLVDEFLGYPLGYASGYSYINGLTWINGYLWGALYMQSAVKQAILQQCVDRKMLDHGGSELVNNLSFSNPNGTFTLRRYFTNRSGSTITINEVGIQAAVLSVLIARDLVSPGQDVLNNETLKVEYTFQITV